VTVRELIEMLSKAPPNAKVRAFDPESNEHEEITGMVYGGTDLCVDLQTDDIE
jgi:hypothetical protein